jgi:hypothetical protein
VRTRITDPDEIRRDRLPSREPPRAVGKIKPRRFQDRIIVVADVVDADRRAAGLEQAAREAKPMRPAAPVTRTDSAAEAISRTSARGYPGGAYNHVLNTM